MPPKKTNKSNRKKIAVYFGLTKGEGDWSEVGILSAEERADPRTFCTFHLDLDEGADQLPEPSNIKSCTVLYNGITPLPALGGGGG